MTELIKNESEPQLNLRLSQVALIRTALAKANVLAVRVIGPPGAGKTQLLQETLRQLSNCRRVAVIVVNPAAGRDADRLHGAAGFVHHLDAPVPSAAAIWRVLQEIDLAKLDMVLIECAGGLAPLPDVGQDASVAVFSVSGGDDKAMEYSELLRHVSAVVLTKIDLLTVVKFDSQIFRADVDRINSGVTLHELSALTGIGMFSWLAWLNERQADKRSRGQQEPKREFNENFVG
jgi:hydrogenase nickel incorporation protein HypB